MTTQYPLTSEEHAELMQIGLDESKVDRLTELWLGITLRVGCNIHSFQWDGVKPYLLGVPCPKFTGVGCPYCHTHSTLSIGEERLTFLDYEPDTRGRRQFILEWCAPGEKYTEVRSIYQHGGRPPVIVPIVRCGHRGQVFFGDPHPLLKSWGIAAAPRGTASMRPIMRPTLVTPCD